MPDEYSGRKLREAYQRRDIYFISPIILCSTNRALCKDSLYIVLFVSM